MAIPALIIVFTHEKSTLVGAGVVRVRPKNPGMYSGVLDISVDGKKQPKLDVSVYGNGEWADYLIPRQGWNYAMEQKPGERLKSPKEGPPDVTVRWLTLSAQ